ISPPASTTALAAASAFAPRTKSTISPPVSPAARSLPAASSSAPVLGSDLPAITITRVNIYILTSHFKPDTILLGFIYQMMEDLCYAMPMSIREKLSRLTPRKQIGQYFVKRNKMDSLSDQFELSTISDDSMHENVLPFNACPIAKTHR